MSKFKSVTELIDKIESLTGDNIKISEVQEYWECVEKANRIKSLLKQIDELDWMMDRFFVMDFGKYTGEKIKELSEKRKYLERRIDRIILNPKEEMTISEDRIIEARNKDMIGLMMSYGIDVKRNTCKCPFHEEKTGSCHVYDHHYHCFGCGEHGDTIDFVMKKENCTFPDAIIRLTNY